MASEQKVKDQEPELAVEASHTSSNAPVDDFVLPAKSDIYKGMTISAHDLPEGTEEFEARLSHSLEVWRMEGKRGVWIVVPIEKSSFIPIAVSLGFEFHHTTPSSVTLTTWLPGSAEPNKLPQFSPVTIGVGGLVIDEASDSVLLVQVRRLCLLMSLDVS